MKTPPKNPEFDRFTDAMRQIMTVSKTELNQREAEYQKASERRIFRPGPKRGTKRKPTASASRASAGLPNKAT